MKEMSGTAIEFSSQGARRRRDCQLVVIGGGPGGYSAAFRAADLGVSTLLVERGRTLGGVCLNVGCIPTKTLLHVAEVIEQAKQLSERGVAFGEPTIDLDRLRGATSRVVNQFTSGLAGLAQRRKVEVVRGVATFRDPHLLLVQGTDAAPLEIHFEQAIIAAGSEAVAPADLLSTAIAAGIAEEPGASIGADGSHPRLVDSTGALALPFVPRRLLVIGGGVIGLEMATIYSALGATVDLVERGSQLLATADRDLVKAWQRRNAERFERVLLSSVVSKLVAADDEVRVWFNGPTAPTGPTSYDLVLVAVGRSPNGNKLGVEHAGVQLKDGGYIAVDSQMRSNVPHIFAVGDIAGPPLLAHKALHEGRVAAEAAAGQPSHFDALVIPNVAYTDPEIAWVGATEEDCRKAGRAFRVASFPWQASGRASASARSEGHTKLVIDAVNNRVIGGAIVGLHAGELIGELALAIEIGCDPADLAQTIHPHPTLSETLPLAAEVHLGTSIDLLNVKRQAPTIPRAVESG